MEAANLLMWQQARHTYHAIGQREHPLAADHLPRDPAAHARAGLHRLRSLGTMNREDVIVWGTVAGITCAVLALWLWWYLN